MSQSQAQTQKIICENDTRPHANNLATTYICFGSFDRQSSMHELQLDTPQTVWEWHVS